MTQECQNKEAYGEYCEAAVLYALETFEPSAWIDLASQFYLNALSPELEQAMKKGVVMSMPLKDFRAGFMEGCVRKGVPSICSCIFEKNLSKMGDERLREYIVQLGLDKAPPEELEIMANQTFQDCTLLEKR